VNAYWLSWYHERRYGPFELHTPWWVSGLRFTPMADTVVAAVQAESEEAAWKIVHEAYDVPPTHLEKRFCKEMEDRQQLPNRHVPWTDEDGRFPHADWMQWSDGG
jgi:hypothetical protein